MNFGGVAWIQGSDKIRTASLRAEQKGPSFGSGEILIEEQGRETLRPFSNQADDSSGQVWAQESARRQAADHLENQLSPNVSKFIKADQSLN